MQIPRMQRQNQRTGKKKSSSYDIRLPGSMLQVGNIQHSGNRRDQQDAFAFSNPSEAEFIEQKGILATVADGMGGMEKGAEASRAAVQAMIGAHEAWEGDTPVSEWMRRAIGRANRAVLEIAEEARLEGKVGTTLSVVLIYGNDICWISVGDSRIYLFRNGELTQLTEDHVYARNLQEKVRKGEMGAEEAAQHPDRGLLTSYLGMPKLKHIDQNEHPIRLQDEDQLMLCSDGLYEGLHREQIHASLELAPQAACNALLQQVVGRADKHQDNVTVMVLGYEQDREHPSE